MRIRGSVIVVALLAGCGAATPARSAGPSETQLACADFVLSVRDFMDGLLTDDELRAEVKTAHERLEGSALEQPARNVLAGVTSGSVVDALDAMAVLIERCDVVMG